MENIQNEYICNANMTPIWDGIRNAYMNELSENAQARLRGANEYVFRTIKQFTSKGGIEGWFASKYDEMAKHMTGEYRRIAEKVAERITEGRILEIGPGPAYLSIELSKIGRFQIIGLDISETMIDIAERNVKKAGIKNISFKLGDAADMPFGDEMFDFVVSNALLHHWREPVKVFNEIHRVLKKRRECVNN